MSTVVNFDKTARQAAKLRGDIAKGGGGGDNGDMEARVAKLEASSEHILREMSEIRIDVREIKRDMSSDFRLLFGALIAVALGLAGLMAKGFGWLQ